MPKRSLTPEVNKGAICKVCNGNMLTANGCKPFEFIHENKQYSRFKVGDAGDFYENGNADTWCTDCGSKHGHYHHPGCDCEYCPVCGDQLLFCDCDLCVTY